VAISEERLLVCPDDLSRTARRHVGGTGSVDNFPEALRTVALLSPKVQRSRRGIGCVTALLILSEVVRNWWLVVPASGKGFSIVDVLAMLGVIGRLRWRSVRL
jgi:hypothetical protein